MKKYILLTIISAFLIPFASHAASVSGLSTTTSQIDITPSIDQAADMTANGFTTNDFWMGVLIDQTNGDEYLTIDRAPANSPIARFQYTSHAESFQNLPQHNFTYKILGTVTVPTPITEPYWSGKHASGNPYPAGSFTVTNDTNSVLTLYSESINLAPAVPDPVPSDPGIIPVSVISASISNVVQTVSDSLTDNLPTIMATFGVLIALGVIIHFVRRFIGSKV